MFKQHKINNCNCYDSGDYRIVQQKGAYIFHAYKASSWDEDGNITGYSSIHKEVGRIERHPELDERGRKKKDDKGNVIMLDIPVIKAKEYPTLEAAMADCV